MPNKRDCRFGMGSYVEKLQVLQLSLLPSTRKINSVSLESVRSSLVLPWRGCCRLPEGLHSRPHCPLEWSQSQAS